METWDTPLLVPGSLLLPVLQLFLQGPELRRLRIPHPRPGPDGERTPRSLRPKSAGQSKQVMSDSDGSPVNESEHGRIYVRFFTISE